MPYRILFLAMFMMVSLPAIAADEVVISERGNQTYKTNSIIQPIHGQRITTQVIDAGTLSSAFNGATSMVQVCANGAAIWYKIGASGVSATANTDGNEFLPSGMCRDEPVMSGQFIDTAADS